MVDSQNELRVRPISARLTRDTETFGKMDPYCVVILGRQQQRTKVHNEGGRTPRWQDELRFTLSHERELKFQVWDKDTATNDDLVGESVLPVAALQNSVGDWQNNIELHYRKVKAGTLSVSISLGGNARRPAQAGYEAHAEYQSHGYDPQAYPAQGYPPQQYPPQSYPPQAYDGYQAYPPQQYNPQYAGYEQYPPQGYPAQQGVPGVYPDGTYMPQAYPPNPNYPPQGYY